MSASFEKSEQVHTPAKPCEPPRRRRCLDIEYKRRHGCMDKWDVVLVGISLHLTGIAVGILLRFGGG